MRIGLVGFSAFLVLAWIAIVVVTIHAVGSMGAAAAGPTFLGDFSHPWRAQFNTDFGLHLLLVAAWMIYRARTWPGGLICGTCAILMGGVFTFAFVAIVVVQARGDVAFALTGRRRS